MWVLCLSFGAVLDREAARSELEIKNLCDFMSLLNRISCLQVIVLVSFCLGSAHGACQITNAIPDTARSLPLSAVRLTDGPLKHAQDLIAKYLLELEPDRMLAGYRLRAGLEPKAPAYGGWDSVRGKQLTGHIAGHYLSAVSLMYAGTGDPRFKERADYIVKELKEVQDKRGTGYLGALTDSNGTDGAVLFEQIATGDIRSSSFDLNGMWSPWYTLHKTFAGLRDAYRYTGNCTALELEIKFAEWAERILSKLDDTQIQRMLNTEFGGMNEVLADLYADTGDTRWLALSYRFDHRAVVEPLKRGEDCLAGLHGNTQVPKLLGHLVRYAYTGNYGDGAAARFFWERVVYHHSFATGGHGKDEYFGTPDELSERIDGRTAESCNVYNMLKLTRRLFALQPDIRYAEFHERALFNHVLGSIDPADGRVCYMVPVGRGVQREYQDMFSSFTCCVGTGMESHALHGHGIYYEAGDKLWVNLYVSSTAEWKDAGVILCMETDFPEGNSAKLRLALKKSRKFTLALRRPSWATDGFAMKLNGKPVKGLPKPGSYVELRRRWRTGDTIELVLPKKLWLERLADNHRRVAIMWGPLVLAGDLGPEADRRLRRRQSQFDPSAVPVFVAADRPVTDWVKPIPGKPGMFRTVGVGREHDIDLVPFYRLHRRTYAVYWDLFTPAEWEQRKAEEAAERQRLQKLEAVTIAYVQPGDEEAERTFNFQGQSDSGIEYVLGRPGRHGRSWFSFDVPVEPAHPMALVVSYHSGARRRPQKFQILIDGRLLAEQEVTATKPSRFYDVEYVVPSELVAGKEKVTVRFESIGTNDIATVFGIRMVRVDASR